MKAIFEKDSPSVFGSGVVPVAGVVPILPALPVVVVVAASPDSAVASHIPLMTVPGDVSGVGLVMHAC